MLTRTVLLFAATCTAYAVASAADLPARKPGLWQITITTVDSRVPPLVETVCLDTATDQLLYKVSAGATQKMCARLDLRSAAGSVALDAQCTLMGSTATIQSKTVMNGDSAYHTEGTVHYEPALFGKSNSKSTQDGKWLGACPAGMKPGDITTAASPTMPVPMKMNLNEMFKAGQ